ncbi:MAG: hypothetical protein ACSHXY_14200 [Alphaproteobacteria bacterium]
MRVLVILACLCLMACDPYSDDSDVSERVSPAEAAYYKTLGLEKDEKRFEPYDDVLYELNDLGIAAFVQGNFSGCAAENLETYEVRRQLPENIVAALALETRNKSAEEIFDYMLMLADKTSDESVAFFVGLGIQVTEAAYVDGLEDRIINHLVWQASEMGSVYAANEIGASLLYCYQNTKQNIAEAVRVLKVAVRGEDPMAMMSLGQIYYSGLDGFEDKAYGRELQDRAFELWVKKLREAREGIFVDELPSETLHD